MSGYDGTGKWIATQIESALGNAAARIKAKKPRKVRNVQPRVVGAEWDVIRQRKLDVKWASNERFEPAFNHKAHVKREIESMEAELKAAGAVVK